MSTSAFAIVDEYVVKLPTGAQRVMSVDELDAALEAGAIHSGTPICAVGTTRWTTLGVLAGLDDVAPAPVAPSAPAFVVPPSPNSIAPMSFGGPALADDDDALGLKHRRRGAKVVGIVFGAAAVFAIVFGIQAAIRQSLASSAAEAALASLPPPPPAAVSLPAPKPSATVAASASASAPAAPPPVADKDKKKGKLPGLPSAKKKK